MNGVAGSAFARVQRIGIEPDPARGMFGEDPLGVVPGARGRPMHRGIGIENAAQVGIERLRAFFGGQDIQEIVAEIGIEARQRVEKRGFQLCAGAEEGRAQHDAGDPIRDAPAHRPAPASRPRSRRRPSSVQSRISRGSSPCPRSDAAAYCLRGGPWGGCGRRRADRTAPHGTVRDRTAAGDRAGSRCRGRHADRPRQCRRRGRRFRRRSRGRRRPRSSSEVSGANGSARLPAGFARVGVRRHGRRPSPACPRRNCDR